MKLNKLTIAAFIIMLSVSSLETLAQKANDNNPIDKAAMLTDKMVELLSLNEAQTNEIKRINLEFIEKDLELRSDLKGKREQLKEERSQVKTEYEQEIISVLDEGQKKIYLESISNRAEKRAEKKAEKTDN